MRRHKAGKVSPATMAAADVHPEVTSKYRRRFQHIDAMRAFAVGVVVVAHAGLGDIVPGGSGVTIFFAISGFIITHLVIAERKATGGFKIGGFYLRRFWKLAPPFVVVVAIPTAIYATLHPVHLFNFGSQVFFFFNWIYMHKGDAYVLPGSGVLWSLSIEEQFYIVFALCGLVAIKRANYLRFLGVLAVVAIIVPLVIRIIITLTAFSHHRTYYGTDTRIDGIAFGVLAAVGLEIMTRPHPSLGVQRVKGLLGSDLALVLSLAAYLFSLLLRNPDFRETIRYSIQAAAASVVILYGFLGADSRLFKLFHRVAAFSVFQFVGLASYSIYICHLSLDKWFLNATNEQKATGPQIVLLVVAGAAVGMVVWRLVEVPVARARTKARRSKKPVGARA